MLAQRWPSVFALTARLTAPARWPSLAQSMSVRKAEHISDDTTNTTATSAVDSSRKAQKTDAAQSAAQQTNAAAAKSYDSSSSSDNDSASNESASAATHTKDNSMVRGDTRARSAACHTRASLLPAG